VSEGTKTGRPKGRKTSVKRVTVWLPAEEAALIDELMEAHGETSSFWVRLAIREARKAGLLDHFLKKGKG